MSCQVKIATFNTNGLRNKTKRLAVFEWLNKKNNSIIFLQKTHSSLETETEWKQDMRNFDLYFSHGTTSTRGVCILISKRLDCTILDKVMDKKGRFLLLHIKDKESEYVLGNLYAPTKDKKIEQLSFFHYVQSILTQYIEKPIVIGGDLNTYLNPELDKCGGIREVQSESSKAIEDLCDQFCLFEVYRFLFKEKAIYLA